MPIQRLLISFITILILFSGLLNAQQSQRMERKSATIDKYVVDKTGTLTQDQIHYLLTKLVNFEKETSNQLVVYMIPTLDGDPIEDVSVRIAEENKIGQEGKDNGILLLIAKNDRQLRIEVGYGLEGALPDATASSIIRNEITPEFKKGDYFTGIDNGIEAIIAATKGEYEPIDEDSSGGPGLCLGIPFVAVIFFAIIFFMIVLSFIQRLFGCGKKWSTGGSAKSGSSGWWGGSWSSGSSSSSGSSFGSFSGGGGSFGGGGASGSW